MSKNIGSLSSNSNLSETLEKNTTFTKHLAIPNMIQAVDFLWGGGGKYKLDLEHCIIFETALIRPSIKGGRPTFKDSFRASHYESFVTL